MVVCVAHLAPLYRTVRRGSILHKIYAHLSEKILLMVVRGTPNRTERDRFVTYSYPGKCYLFLLLKTNGMWQQDNNSWKKSMPWLCAAVQFYKGALDKDFRQNAVSDYMHLENLKPQQCSIHVTQGPISGYLHKTYVSMRRWRVADTGVQTTAKSPGRLCQVA